MHRGTEMKQMLLVEEPEVALPDPAAVIEYLNRSARECWMLLHDWSGPVLGGLVNFENTFAEDVDGVNHYVSGGTARVIELTESHCTVISVGYTWTDNFNRQQGKGFVTERIPSHCNGKQFKLPLYQVSPCHSLIHGGSVWIIENGSAQKISNEQKQPIETT